MLLVREPHSEVWFPDAISSPVGNIQTLSMSLSFSCLVVYLDGLSLSLSYFRFAEFPELYNYVFHQTWEKFSHHLCNYFVLYQSLFPSETLKTWMVKPLISPMGPWSPFFFWSICSSDWVTLLICLKVHWSFLCHPHYPIEPIQVYFISDIAVFSYEIYLCFFYSSLVSAEI